MRRTRAIATVLVIAVVAAAVAFALSSSPAPSTRKGSFLTNDGFETGDLSGWKTAGPLVPTVESTIVNNGTYAARFETPGNGNALDQCALQALGCSTVNSSTISQDVSGLAVSPNTTVSIALYPSFQSPAMFQMTLDFAPATLGSPDVTIYYIFAASSQQCNTYSELVVNGSGTARAFCLSAPQGGWTVFTRSVMGDLPTTLKPSDLGSAMTLSLSFAGGNSTDAAYVDSMSLR